MSTVRIALGVVVLFLLPVTAWARVEVKDAALGFSFELPVGFVETPQGRDAPGIPPGDIIQCYTRPGVGKRPGTIVIVKRLHGTLGNSPSAAHGPLRDGRTLDLSDKNWKAFRLQVNRIEESANGDSLITFNVQVPLSPEAVQLSISGTPNQEKRNRAMVRTILASFDGASTWDSASSSPRRAGTAMSGSSGRPLSAEERGERFGTGVAMLLIFIGVIVAVVVAIFRRRALHAVVGDARVPSVALEAPGGGAARLPAGGGIISRPNWADPQSMTATKARLLGAAALGGSIVLYLFCFQEPLNDAAAHKPSISLMSNGVLVLPILVGTAVFLLINGNRRLDLPHPWPKVLSIAFYGILLAAGMALDTYLHTKLKSMGYSTW